MRQMASTWAPSGTPSSSCVCCPTSRWLIWQRGWTQQTPCVLKWWPAQQQHQEQTALRKAAGALLTLHLGACCCWNMAGCFVVTVHSFATCTPDTLARQLVDTSLFACVLCCCHCFLLLSCAPLAASCRFLLRPSSCSGSSARTRCWHGSLRLSGGGTSWPRQRLNTRCAGVTVSDLRCDVHLSAHDALSMLLTRSAPPVPALVCMQIAQDALAAATSAQASASSHLQVVKARLPQPPPPPPPPPPPAEPQLDGDAADDDGGDGAEGQGALGIGSGGISAASGAVPPLNLQQLAAATQEVTLSPEQRRSLSEAQAGLESAEAQLQAAEAAVTAAGKAGVLES